MLNKEYLCGFGSLRPGWIQGLASARAYAFVFAVLGIFQAAYRSYLVGTLSTVEKRFSMSSKQCSIIMIGDDISPIIGSVVIMFFMKDPSKPIWIALGMVVSGIGCIVSMFPFFLYGPASQFASWADLNATDVIANASLTSPPAEMCAAGRYEDPRCESRASDGSMSTIPLWSLFLGNFFNGMGGTAYYVLGTAYLDDNVKKKNSAIYLGAIYFVRMLGPILGFTLSSHSLKLWESPMSSSGGLTPKDPRWIGAWWMGYVVVCIGLWVMAVPMLFFPKKIRAKSEANNKQHKKHESVLASLQEAATTVVRVVRNPVFSFRLVGFIAGYIALAGYYINFPKYLEHQFQQTASQASAITAPVYLFSNSIGILIGGAITHLFKPPPRIVALHCFLANVFATFGFYMLSTIQCPVPETIVDSCGSCECSTSMYAPVCELQTQRQYFSPCLAGCSQVNGTTSFFDCACLDMGGTVATAFGSETAAEMLQVAPGRCAVDCSSSLLTYSIVVFSIQLVLSTTYVGGNLLSLRSILPEDKSVALAFQSTCLNLFAFIPYPIIFSFIMDLSCDVWEDKCGSVGACWLYNLPNMRTRIHHMSLLLMLTCSVFQGLVFIFSGSIVNFYEDPDDQRAEKDPKDLSGGTASKNGIVHSHDANRRVSLEIRQLHPSLEISPSDPDYLVLPTLENNDHNSGRAQNDENETTQLMNKNSPDHPMV